MPFGQALLTKLRQEDAKNTFIRRPDDPRGPWLLRIKLPDDLQERFALAPELLLMALGETGVEARDVDRCRAEIIAAGLRLDSEVVIVVDLQPGLFGRLQRLDRRRPWVPWQPGRRGAEFVFPPLLEQIARQIAEKDIFEERDPVRGHQVIGRRDDIRDLSGHLLSGAAVGVFGLRKVGKTTLVRAVVDTLDPAGGALSMRRSPARDWHFDMDDPSQVIAAWVDCQGIYPRTLDRLALSLVEQIAARRSSDVAPRIGLDASPLERLSATLGHWAGSETVPLAIILDEYDLLFEGPGGDGAIPGLEHFFGGLRAFSQETGQLSLTVIGRDPEYFRSPTWNGVPNPMLGWFIPKWVGPLDRKGADELLSTLGRRVGLLAGKRTKDTAYRWTLGHPLLHRQYGSALRELVRATGQPAEQTETDTFCDEAVAHFLERDAVTDLCREIFDILSTRYPPANGLLEALAQSPSSAWATLLERHGGFRAEPARVLRNFGVLLGSPSTPMLPEVLCWYAQNVHPTAISSAAQ